MRDLIRPAEKRLDDHAQQVAEQFDATILHNRVFETVPVDPLLREIVDVVERAYRIEESDEQPPEVRRAAFKAAERLNGHVDRLVEDAVARELAQALTDMDDWGDTWDEEEIEAARTEASGWLYEHDEARERNGLTDVLVEDADELADPVATDGGDEIVLVHRTIYPDDADIEIDNSGDVPTVANHDELPEVESVIALRRSKVEVHGLEGDIVEPGDSLWREEFEEMGAGDIIELDEVHE